MSKSGPPQDTPEAATAVEPTELPAEPNIATAVAGRGDLVAAAPFEAAVPLAASQPTGREPIAEPTKTHPVVFATWPLEELVVPAADGRDAIRVTALGVALNKTQAKHVEDAAWAAGVRLRDLTPAEKD